MRLDQLVEDLGFDVKHGPTMFTECFSPTGTVEEKRLSKVSQGLSGMLKRLLPQDLSEFSGENLINHILSDQNGKIQTGAMYQEMPNMMMEGLPMAIAFQIIRFNEYDPVEYPSLALAREAINASSKMCKVAAKGAHKGPQTEQVQSAVKDGLQVNMQNQRNLFYMLLEYAVEKMISEQDPKAKALLESMYSKQKPLQIENPQQKQ